MFETSRPFKKIEASQKVDAKMDMTGRKIYNLILEKNKYSYTLNIEASKGINIVQILDSHKKAIDNKKITIK